MTGAYVFHSILSVTLIQDEVMNEYGGAVQWEITPPSLFLMPFSTLFNSCFYNSCVSRAEKRSRSFKAISQNETAPAWLGFDGYASKV